MLADTRFPLPASFAAVWDQSSSDPPQASFVEMKENLCSWLNLRNRQNQNCPYVQPARAKHNLLLPGA